MILQDSKDSLLKYDNPVLVSKTSSAKNRTFVVSTQQSLDPSPVPPRPPPKPDNKEHENTDLLNSILPPREWTQGNERWVQYVSAAPCTRTDVLQLREQLDEKLVEKQARLTGVCPIRRELYSQCFDELIRQVTINCAERGLLLLSVREEIQLTLATYQTLHDSSVAFGMRKALLSEHGRADMEKKVAEVQKEKEELIKQLNEQKAKCDEIERREAERRQAEEKKLTEKIHFLERTNQQLKNQLESLTTAKN